MKNKINVILILSTLLISALALAVLAAVFDFSVSVNPSIGSVMQGNSANTTVTVSLISSPSKLVRLSSTGCPPSAACSFSRTSGIPTYTSTFNVAASASTPAGTYPINIIGTKDGKSHSAIYTLTVNAQQSPFDFSLSVNPASATIVQGDTASTTASISLISGASQQVLLSSSGCPSYATCTFSPSSGNPNYASTFTVATAPFTPPSTWIINITGTGGGKTRTAQYTLTTLIKCTARSPTVTISPFTQSSPAGTSLLYIATVTNNDASTCSASLFNLTTSVIPAGWSGFFYINSLLINPGSSQSTNFSITSSSGASPGSYNFSNTAFNYAFPSVSGSGSAVYQVI